MRKGKLSLARAEDLQFLEKSCKIERNADVAELADAPDLGSGGQPCRFKSCRPHQTEDKGVACVLICLSRDSVFYGLVNFLALAFESALFFLKRY